jgi:hypothetical protein
MTLSSKLRFTFAAFASFAVTAWGQIDGPPGLIDYQGQLLNSLGGPITGAGGPGTSGTAENFEIRFRIWDAQTAGGLIWAEKQIVTVSEAGLFSVRLGEGEGIATADNDLNPLTGSIANGLGALLSAFNGNERFLGVTVMDPPATPGEIQPRLAFLAAPFALIAEKARFAEFGPSGAAFSANSVGVGVASPETTLHVSGKTFINDGLTGIPTNGTYGGDGTRLVLWPGAGASTPYGFGISPSTLWAGVPANSWHRWFTGTTETMSLNPRGDLRINGYLQLGYDGFIDDDGIVGGGADDWIRLSGFVEMRSNDDNYGIVLRDRDTNTFMGLTQVDGSSYLSDNNVSSQYFLKGDGRNASTAGTFSAGRFASLTANSVVDIRGSTLSFLHTTKPGAVTDEALNFRETDGGVIMLIRSFSAGGPKNFEVLQGQAYKPGGGSWGVSSDIRLKKNVQPVEGAIDRLMKLRSVTFEFKDPVKHHQLPGTQIGMIAQEVEEVFPEWVSVNADGYKTIGFRGFESLTVQALRELREEKDAQLEERDVRIADLEGRLAKLEALLVK